MIVVITVSACVLEFVLVGGKLFPLRIRLLSGTVYTRVGIRSPIRKKKLVTIEDEKAVSNAGDRHRKYRRYHDVFLIVKDKNFLKTFVTCVLK